MCVENSAWTRMSDPDGVECVMGIGFSIHMQSLWDFFDY